MKSYPEYKDRGVEWIGDIPIGWHRATLKRVCNEITDGSHFSPTTQDEGYPYITVKDIKNGYIDFDNCNKISETDYIELKKNGCQPIPNDVLLTKDGTIGKAVVIKRYREFVILSSLGLLRPNLSLIDPQYLRYFLISGINLDQMLSSIHGSALTRLTIKLIKDLIVFYPPLIQQRSLAHNLDNKTSQLDTLIEKKQKLIELLKELRTAIINQAVTKGLDPNVKMKDSDIEWLGEIPEHWEVKRLKYCDSVIMGQSPSSEDYNTDNNGLPFLQGNADFSVIFPQPRIWCDTANKIAINNDILLSVRAPIGAVNLADQEYGIGRGLCAIRSQKTHYKFLYYLALSLKDEFNSLGTGSTFTAISTDEVENVCIPQPPFHEQRLISTCLDNKSNQIDIIIRQETNLIEQLLEYRSSLITEAVTGKIDVRDEVDHLQE